MEVIDMDIVVMVVIAMEDLMEVMVVTEAMEVIDMERERPKLMLSLVMDMVVMEAMVMADLMEVMVVTEPMEVTDMEREMLRLNQDMDTEAMEVMVMEDP